MGGWNGVHAEMKRTEMEMRCNQRLVRGSRASLEAGEVSLEANGLKL